jgi:hypothetical protein
VKSLHLGKLLQKNPNGAAHSWSAGFSYQCQRQIGPLRDVVYSPVEYLVLPTS